MKKQTVVFITYNKYPDGDAGATRLSLFAKMLGESGYRVLVISLGNSTKYHICTDSDGVEHISLRSNNNSKIFRFSSFFLFPIRLRKILRKIRFSAVLFTEVGKCNLKIIKKYAKKYDASCIYDAVEWYSPEQFAKYDKDPAYIENNRYNTHYIDQNDRVISISSYLHNHFLKRGIKSIQIPVLADTSSVECKKNNSDGIIKIIYAGSPGKKDYLGVILEAFSMLTDEELSRFSFTVIGCTLKEIITENSSFNIDYAKLKDVINPQGKITRNKVLMAYEKSDFSIFIRSEELRYARAGFPTKFVESLSTGTPVICNVTSDLGDYLIDKYNGISVENCNVQSVVAVFRYILEINQSELQQMKRNARLTAEEYFDYRKYKKVFLEFVVDNEKENSGFTPHIGEI